jgi:hypothetical protein
MIFLRITRRLPGLAANPGDYIAIDPDCDGQPHVTVQHHHDGADALPVLAADRDAWLIVDGSQWLMDAMLPRSRRRQSPPRRRGQVIPMRSKGGAS